jgi:hypothetical protein
MRVRELRRSNPSQVDSALLDGKRALKRMFKAMPLLPISRPLFHLSARSVIAHFDARAKAVQQRPLSMELAS